MRRILCLIVCFVLFDPLQVNAENLTVEPISEKEIKSGTYTLILYGSRHSNDVETIAYLDPVDDDYEMEIYAPDFDYRKEASKGLEDALKIAKNFVSWHSSFMNFRLSKIVTKQGVTVGYEIKPLYKPFEFGRTDVFDNSYWLRGSKAFISVNLLPIVERFLYHSSTPTDIP